MSFESVPCGSPESHTVIEEPAPSLYSGEETDDRLMKTLKRPQEVPESIRLADTAKIEDELIMNEEQIARVNLTGRINPAPPLEPPVLTRVTPRRNYCEDRDESDARDDSARRNAMRAGFFGRQWIDLNGVNPQVAEQNHSSEFMESHHLEHGSIKSNRSKSLHEKVERDSRVGGGVSVIKSAREQEVESDSDTDNSSARESRKLGLHDKEESMNLTCNENISVEQLRDEREEDMRRSYFYSYGMGHEDVNNRRVSRVPEYERDGRKEKSLSNGQAGESGDIRKGNKVEDDGTEAAVSVYYMPYPAHMAPISRARQAGMVSQGNAALQQAHMGGHTRDQLAHLAISDGRGGYRIQQVEYRPEQQVPIANSSEENAERNMMIAGVGRNAGLQYVDRQGLIPGGFAVVPGIGPVRVMDGMFYHQPAIPMGAEPSHYENFAPVSSFMPMGNLQGQTTCNPSTSATSTPTNDSGAAQTQDKALNVVKSFTSPSQQHIAASSSILDDKRSTSSPVVTSDRDSPAPNGDETGDCKKFPSTRQRNKQRHVGGAKSEIKCDQCGKLFGSSSALAKHKLTHSDERRYVCQICSKGFKRQDHLNGHMVTHRDKKPYECSFADCDKSYCDMRSLRRHLENHHAALAASSTPSGGGNKQTNTVTAVTVVPAVGHVETVSGQNISKVRTRAVRGDRNKETDESSGSHLQVGGYDSGKSSGRSTPSGAHDVIPLRDRMINQIVRDRNSDSISSATSEEAGVHTGETSRDHTPETASHTESTKQLTAVNMLKKAAERAQEEREKQAGGERFQQHPYMAYQEGVPYQQWYPAGMYNQDPRIVYQYAQGIMFPTQAYHVSSVTGMVPDVQNRQAVGQRFGSDPHDVGKPSLRNVNQMSPSSREHESGDTIQQPYLCHPKTRNTAGTPTNPMAIAVATAKDSGKYRYTREGHYGVHPSGTQWQPVRYDDNTAIPFSSEHKQGLMGNNKSTFPHSIEGSGEGDNDSNRHYGKHASFRAEHSDDSYGPGSKRRNAEHTFSSSRDYERFMALQDAQHKASRTEDNNNYDSQANGPSKTSDESPGFFRNPSEVLSPRRKQRPKPEPLQIPDHVSTNFRPGSPKNRSRPCTPPIYTPPPMLSPHSIFSHIARPLTPRSSGIPQLPMTPSRLLLSSRSCRSSVEADDESYQFPEPKINIGSQFQAEIPQFVGFRSKPCLDAHPATLVWSPLDERKRGRRDEIESYLDVACSVAVVGGGSNKEYALHVLHKAKGNIKEAVRDLLKKKSALPATDPMYSYHYEGSVKWAAKERQTFRNSFRIKGKEFSDLKKEVGSKSVNDCVEFYYLWKATHPEAVRGRTRYVDSDSDEDYEDTSSETNSNPSLFECDFPQCSAKFVSRQALNGHIRVHGGSLFSNSFMKPEPRKRSRTPANSSTTTSGDSVPPVKKRRPAAPAPPPVNPSDPDAPLPEYACKVCGRIFHKIKSRSAHMKTHVKRPDTHDDGKNSAVILKAH